MAAREIIFYIFHDVNIKNTLQYSGRIKVYLSNPLAWRKLASISRELGLELPN
jgi:hypothetical protein